MTEQPDTLDELFDRTDLEMDALVLFENEPMVLHTDQDDHQEVLLVDLSREAQGIRLTIGEVHAALQDDRLQPAAVYPTASHVAISCSTAQTICRLLNRELSFIAEQDDRGYYRRLLEDCRRELDDVVDCNWRDPTCSRRGP